MSEQDREAIAQQNSGCVLHTRPQRTGLHLPALGFDARDACRTPVCGLSDGVLELFHIADIWLAAQDDITTRAPAGAG
jgi:hypothetical protein